MAVEDLAADLRARLTDTVGLDLRCDALSETQVLFASTLGLMREQTLSSTVLCPAIYRFPEQLCGGWSATPEGQRAKAFGCRGRCYGPALLSPRQDVATDAIHYTPGLALCCVQPQFRTLRVKDAWH